jgi:hypothetical protein
MLHKRISALAILFALAAGAFAYEVRISKLNTWELTFASKAPRSIEVTEENKLVLYRYVIYQVTNNTAQDVDFYPTFQLETEDGAVTNSLIYAEAYKQLEGRFGKGLLDSSHVAGVIKPGETRKGVAIFKGADPASDVLTVYVAGLSGDIKSQKNSEGKLTVLYRTYKLVYQRPGDEYDLSRDAVTLKSSEWVWRE